MPGGGPPRLLARYAPLLVICAAILAEGVRTTRDLEWPGDSDLYRDIAQAQTIADGSLLSDPFYRGETLWHNPLAPLVVALLSKPLGLPVHAAYVRLGAYLNLLAPIAFYLWVARLAGAGGAAVATFGFVFYRDPWAPAWVTAAYSPWLFAMTSSQSPFYFGLGAYRGALLEGTTVRHVVAGLLLGITFLAAAPPAFLFGGVVTAGCICGMWGWLGGQSADTATTPPPSATVRVLANHAVLVLAALVVSCVFLYSIVGRYRLRVLNPLPMRWEWAGLYGLPEFARTHLGWPAALAAVGLAALVLGARRRPVDAVIVAAFTLTVAVLLGYRLFFEQVGITLPPLVPSHYFVFYMKALQWLLVGVAVSSLFAWFSRLGLLSARWLSSTAVAPAALVAALALGVYLAMPQYRSRGYFESARRAALAEGARPHLNEAFAWIRENSSPGDVFLASPDMALRVVGPAGRKVVVIGEVVSSPYVDWNARARSANRMWRALLDGDLQAFRSLAQAFQVRYLISWRQDQPWLDGLLEERPLAGLSPAFKSGGVRISRLTPGPRPSVGSPLQPQPFQQVGPRTQQTERPERRAVGERAGARE